MTPQEKKEYVNRIIASGDKRSYNEINADLELQLWRDKFSIKAEKIDFEDKIK